MQATSRINNILKLANSGKNQASAIKLILYDGAWFTEHNGTTFVAICQTDGMAPIFRPQWLHLTNITGSTRRVKAVFYTTSTMKNADLNMGNAT